MVKEAILVILEIADVMPAKSWKAVQPLFQGSLIALQKMCECGREDEVKEILQQLIEVCESAPSFFRQNLAELAKTGFTIAKVKTELFKTKAIFEENYHFRKYLFFEPWKPKSLNFFYRFHIRKLLLKLKALLTAIEG